MDSIAATSGPQLEQYGLHGATEFTEHDLSQSASIGVRMVGVQAWLDDSGGTQPPNPTPFYQHKQMGVVEHMVNPANGAPGAMSPPPVPRKKKAPTLRECDWEPYKNRIIELHIEENRSIPDVKRIMEAKYGFKAEIRQYRLRLSQWKVDKNIKPREMRSIVKKRQQRRLVEVDKRDLTFSVRGQAVGPQKIDRWMKRHDTVQSMPYSPSTAASTPSAVGCQTISQSDSPAPSLTRSVTLPQDITNTLSCVIL